MYQMSYNRLPMRHLAKSLLSLTTC